MAAHRVDKIYITGPVGSGKSTLARRLANGHGFYCCELDRVVHSWDSLTSDNRKRPDDERDAMFGAVISKDRWIVEDTGRRCFEQAMQAADSIILLEPSAWVRRFRILLRWIKQNLGIEKCIYIPDFETLRRMFKWTKSYESGADGLKGRLEAYWPKITVIRNEKDIVKYINESL